MGITIFFLAILVQSDSTARQPQPGVSREQGAAAHSPVIYLRDRARVNGRLALSHLGVETRYGRLQIPIAELHSVRLARRPSAAESESIRAAMEQLDAEDFDAREKATQELRALGPCARRALKESLRTGSEEVKVRAQGILASQPTGKDSEDPSSEEAPEALGDVDDDEIVATRFTVRGRVLEDRFSIETAYGPLEAPLAEIASIVFPARAEMSLSLKVAASRAPPDSWLSTRLRLARGQKLQLKADGQTSVPNYRLLSGPEGTTRYSGSTFESFPMLSLVGRIGKKGKPFLVGKEYTGTAKSDGILYLGIVPFRRNIAAQGAYQVRVETKL